MKAFLEKLYFILVFGELTTAIPRIMSGGPTPDAAAGDTSNPLLLIFNLVVIAGTCYYVFPFLPRLWSALLRLRWTFLLYLWASLSILWTVDRVTSFRLDVYALCYLASAAYFAFRYNTEQLIRLLGRCFLGAGLLSIAGEFLLPPPDDLAPGWSGIFQQKNGLGLCMMLGIAVLLVERKRWTSGRAASLCLYLGMLALSQSFTAIISTCALALFIFSKRLAGWSKAVLWTLLGGLACISMIISDPLELILDAGGKSTNLTGRDVIWAFALKATVDNPIAGHGYGGAFWTEAQDTAMETLHWNPHHAHNGYLEILLDLGLVGLVLTIGLLINTWRRARRLQRFDSTLTPLWVEVLILAAVAHNLTESDFMSTNIFWYLLMLGSFACLRTEEEARGSPGESVIVATLEPELVTA